MGFERTEIADDEEIVCANISEFLEPKGFEV